MENNKRHAKRIPWIRIALIMILLGAIMLGIGWVSSFRGWISGFEGGTIAIKDGRLLIMDMPGEIESTFMEIPDGDRFTDIYIRAGPANIAVVPASPGVPLGLQFTNLEANVEYSGNQLIIDGRRSERIGNRYIHINIGGRREEIVVHLPAGMADSLRIVNASGNIRMDGISTTLLEIRSTSGNVNGRNLNFTNGTLESTSGNIDINGVSWNNLNVQMTSGRIRIAGADIREGGTQIRVTSGNINLGVNGGRDDFTYSFTSTSGAVRVNGERLRGHTGTGGGGDHPISINVVSGNIRLDFER